MDLLSTAFAGAAKQARMLAAGEISSPALVNLYLERIDLLDGQLNAFRTVMRDNARLEAASAQRRLDGGRAPAPARRSDRDQR